MGWRERRKRNLFFFYHSIRCQEEGGGAKRQRERETVAGAVINDYSQSFSAKVKHKRNPWNQKERVYKKLEKKKNTHVRRKQKSDKRD